MTNAEIHLHPPRFVGHTSSLYQSVSEFIRHTLLCSGSNNLYKLNFEWEVSTVKCEFDANFERINTKVLLVCCRSIRMEVMPDVHFAGNSRCANKITSDGVYQFTEANYRIGGVGSVQTE